MNKEIAVQNIRRNFKGPIDVTLREGEQFAGGNFIEDEEGGHFENFEFSFPQAERVLIHLQKIGIEYAEVPNGLIEGANPMIQQLVAMQDRPKLLCHIRNNMQDVNAAIGLGVDGINILTFVDPERIKKAGYESFSDYLNVLKQAVLTAKNHNMQTRVSVEHSWNGYFDKALDVFEFADNLGVDRIGLADTLGIATRFEVEDRITQARKRAPRPNIEVHFHNDGSLAVANAIEALIHGANYIDTTFGGIGERNGITPLSGLLSRLYLFDPEIVGNLHLEFVTPAERDVMKMVGLTVPHDLKTSINGSAHKAGIHTDAITKHSRHLELYEPFDPEIIGNKTRIITDSRISGKTHATMVRAVIPGAIIQ